MKLKRKAPIIFQNTNYKCPKFTFDCYKDNYCISFQQVCDGVQDCYSGDDEENCPERISFYCAVSNENIDLKQVCDYRIDCIDKSDEYFCGIKKN